MLFMSSNMFEAICWLLPEAHGKCVRAPERRDTKMRMHAGAPNKGRLAQRSLYKPLRMRMSFWK